ncbi:hypothetical protein BCR43DRAFT_536817, partial [Syncephalastrum racemosum]
MQRVRGGTLIQTDGHRAYMPLRDMNAYDFVCVNHSEHYRGPDMDGYHPGETFDTNMIEVTPRQRTSEAIPYKLLEFLWHWKHKRDRWYSMVKCLE